MRLLIVTQYFPPETGAPQARLYELAMRLRNKGHKITVLTAMPNYPTGKIFAGYKWKARCSENIDGIKVIRTCLYPSKSSKTLPRILSYLSFGISSLGLGVWGLGRQDIVLIESPPLFLVPFGLLLSKLTRAKPVMMVSDIWPDIIIRMGHASEKNFSTKCMLWLEKFSYNHSYAVALTNPGALEQVQTRFPHLENLTVISNGVDISMFKPQLRDDETRLSLGAGPKDFLIGYCGLHGLAQGLEVVLGAAEQLKNRSDVKFVMIGDGPTKNELMKKAEQMKLPNLTFYERRPKSEMPTVLASLDISLVTLSGRFPGTMPSKVYEALASGTPVVVAKGCEAESLVSQFNVGRSYEPLDAKEMAEATKELVEDRRQLKVVKENCLKLAVRFDRNLISERTEQILQAIVNAKALPEIEW
jgi:glycosyltransferase involved in cell wall biosynthesis